MIKPIKVYRVKSKSKYNTQYFAYDKLAGLIRYDISELHEILPDQQKNPGLYKIKFIDLRFKP